MHGFGKQDQVWLHELGDIDLFDYQLNSIRKDFKAVLDKDAYAREKLFVEIVSKMETYNQVELIKQYTIFLNINESNIPSDNDIVNYNEWLQSKLK